MCVSVSVVWVDGSSFLNVGCWASGTRGFTLYNPPNVARLVAEHALLQASLQLTDVSKGEREKNREREREHRLGTTLPKTKGKPTKHGSFSDKHIWSYIVLRRLPSMTQTRRAVMDLFYG